MATEQVSIPARLSDPQLFALAAIRQRGEVKHWEMSERTHLGDTPDSGDQFERHCIGGSSLQSAIREEFSDLTRTSVPRALQRLDERDLVTRWTGRPPRHSRISPDASRGNHLTLVILTRNGGRVAEEILRRHEDGRYSLSFDTLD